MRAKSQVLDNWTACCKFVDGYLSVRVYSFECTRIEEIICDDKKGKKKRINSSIRSFCDASNIGDVT